MDLLEKYHYYINLKRRKDRNNDTIKELRKLGISKPNRFEAIEDKDGIKGCLKSHIKCIENAKKNKFPFLCIFEDDILINDIDNLKKMIPKFIDYDYDVLYLGGLLRDNKYNFITEELIQVSNVLTRHAYIIKFHYYDKILENLNLRLKDKGNKFFFNKLQNIDKWYLLYNNFIIQRGGYSDIYNKKILKPPEMFNIKIHDSKLPNISIQTPTCGRKIFIPLMINNIKNFDYPKEKIEWNILESNDKSVTDYKKLFATHPKDLEELLGIKIQYNYIKEKLTIGDKRNKLGESSSYDYLINMDDDDMYLPEYLSHSINILINNKKDITGCLDMLFIYPENEFKKSYIQCVDDFKLYHEATMCMKRSHWERYKYNNNLVSGEGECIYGNKNICGKSSVTRCMICTCWNGNTVNKDFFLNYQINIDIKGHSLDILKKIIREVNK